MANLYMLKSLFQQIHNIPREHTRPDESLLPQTWRRQINWGEYKRIYIHIMVIYITDRRRSHLLKSFVRDSLYNNIISRTFRIQSHRQ